MTKVIAECPAGQIDKLGIAIIFKVRGAKRSLWEPGSNGTESALKPSACPQIHVLRGRFDKATVFLNPTRHGIYVNFRTGQHPLMSSDPPSVHTLALAAGNEGDGIRRIGTWFDKLAESFPVMVTLACALRRLRQLSSYRA